MKVSFLTSSGCGQSVQESNQQKPKLVVAVDATFVPMSFFNEQKQLDGFEVDLIREVVENAGFDYELVNVEWGGLFGGLITKKFDMVISSVSILEERKNRMAFSIPYIQSGVAILVRKDIQGIETIEDLERKNSVVGAQINTTSFFFLERFPGIQSKAYEKFGHALIDLENKAIDAAVGDSAQVNYYFKKNKELNDTARLLGSRMTSEDYGIVLRKDDHELKLKIDSSLTNLLENGTVKKLHAKWDLGELMTVPRP